MRQNNTSGTRVQGTPTTVQPTKQAEIRYKTISNNAMLRASESDEARSYLVTVVGSSNDRNRAEISRVYEERHPLMAVGRAVCQFREEYFCYQIEGFFVRIKTVK